MRFLSPKTGLVLLLLLFLSVERRMNAASVLPLVQKHPVSEAAANDGNPCRADSVLGVFPPWEQVLAYWFSAMPDQQIPDPSTCTVQRHPEGWRVQLSAPVDTILLLWSAAKRDFVPFERLVSGNWDSELNRAQRYARWSAQPSDENERLFFGYPEAAEHSVEWLGTSLERPAIQYRFLAQALQDRALSRIPVRRHGKNPGQKQDVADDSLKSALRDWDAAMAQWQLWARQVDSENAALLWSTHMQLAWVRAVVASSLDQKGWTDEAKGILDDLDYPPFYRTYGQNLLQSLPRGARVGVENDRDYYLLEGIRLKGLARADIRLWLAKNRVAGVTDTWICCPPEGVGFPAGLLRIKVPEDSIAVALRTASLMTDSFTYAGIEPGLRSEQYALKAVALYRSRATETAAFLLRHGKREEALRLMNIVFRTFAEWVFPLKSQDLQAIRFYYDADAVDRAAEMGRHLYREVLLDPNQVVVRQTLREWATAAQQVDVLSTYTEWDALQGKR